MMRVGLIVEGLDLNVPGGAVQRDSFGERLICLKPNPPTAVARCLRLQLGKQTPTDAETSRRMCDPHALELCGLVGVELQRSAADWLRAESCDEQKTGGRPEFVGIGRDADGGIEAGVESLVELAEVLTNAVLRVWMKGIERLDLGRQTTLTRRCGRHQIHHFEARRAHHLCPAEPRRVSSGAIPGHGW